MKRVLFALAVVALLAGCSAKGDRNDFFGYMKKPLFASSFSLDHARASPETQQFFVEDGSIGVISIQLWVNATAGGATVQVFDPAGNEAMRATQTTQASFPLSLGAWKVVVTGTPDASGSVDVLVTRGK